MINPIESLAFSLQSQPGVYAILLGSGVSISSGIPTGWGVVLDLINKLAVSQGEAEAEECKANPESWYRKKFKKEPNYSDIIDELVGTSAERQQLLKEYFEPNETERQEGRKMPTDAHRAIARLVKNGYVKVIITTNFDRLMELALREEGIEPSVISTPDQMQGALPLPHQKALLLKIHGDYMDTRILNTKEELEEYPDCYNEYLGRIFDDYGLIVCGWSATWDNALRNAIERTTSRRFTTFWALRGEASDEAKRLIEHRKAEVIQVSDADSFFTQLHAKVNAIHEYSERHSMTIEAAVANAKQFIEDGKKIKLKDLVDGFANEIAESLSGDNSPINQRTPLQSDSIEKGLAEYWPICLPLTSIATICGFYGNDDLLPLWLNTVRRFAVVNERTPEPDIILNLRRFPAVLLTYALALGAIAANNYTLLHPLFTLNIPRNINEDCMLLGLFPPQQMLANCRSMMPFGTHRNDYTSLNTWINKQFHQPMYPVVPDLTQYNETFDKLEILTALSYKYYKPSEIAKLHAACEPPVYWTPCGDFMNRAHGAIRILKEFHSDIDELRGDSELVKSRLFGGSAEECKCSIAEFEKFFKDEVSRFSIYAN